MLDVYKALIDKCPRGHFKICHRLILLRKDQGFTLWRAMPLLIMGDICCKEDIPTYISLSISRKAMVLSPTRDCDN